MLMRACLFVDFLDGKSIEEATEELQNDLLGNKTIKEI